MSLKDIIDGAIVIAPLSTEEREAWAAGRAGEPLRADASDAWLDAHEMGAIERQMAGLWQRPGGVR